MESMPLQSSHYQTILQKQQQLTKYLKYIRYKQPLPKISLNTSILRKQSKKKSLIAINKRQCSQVKQFISSYMQLLKQILNRQSYLSKKIINKLLKFLQQFPTMKFLYENNYTYGKDTKKICLNQSLIINHSNDDMVPLYEKIIEKIQHLKKQGNSKKLLQLGHRIEHLQSLVSMTKNSKLQKITKTQQYAKIFTKIDGDRIDKYLTLQQSINKIEKNFGKFSMEVLKNKELFVNLNRVYGRIKQNEKLRIK